MGALIQRGSHLALSLCLTLLPHGAPAKQCKRGPFGLIERLVIAWMSQLYRELHEQEERLADWRIGRDSRCSFNILILYSGSLPISATGFV
jgi:hypothetical protein